MKILALCLLILTTSCAVRKGVSQVPAFVKENVCSPRALEYITTHQELSPSLTPEKHQQVISEMRTLDGSIGRCYSSELYRTDNLEPFNLCLVVGTNAEGKVEFTDFNTTEIKPTKDFYTCLYEVSEELKLSKYKNLTVIQDFTLYPAN